MYSESDIEAAVAAGALSPAAAASLRDWIATSRRTTVADEEHFRLLTGFNDIFVSIAAVLLLAAVGWLAGSVSAALGGAAIAATAWGLSEYFTRQRRMALPSILLLLAFVGGVFGAAAGLIAEIVGTGDPGARAGAGYAAVAASVAALGALAHWRRFHVPITVAAGVAALAGLALSLLLAAMPAARDAIHPLLFVAGLAAFGVAMWWDMSDRARETRRSDVAFWLHLLAAPLIVHPVFQMLGLLDGGATIGEALVVLLLYVALAAVALAIDRRALMVSALAYVIYAMSVLFREFGALSLNLALTALVIGSALLLLSAFWHVARGAVLRVLPAELRARLPVEGRMTTGATAIA